MSTAIEGASHDGKKAIFRAPSVRCEPSAADGGIDKLRFVITAPSSADSGDVEDARRAAGLGGEASARRIKGDIRHDDESSSNSCSWTTPILSVVVLSLFSILGGSFRVFLGNLFGDSCYDDDENWLSQFSRAVNLCVTSDGSLRQGGAIFSDLPANMIGSFIMGLLQPSQDVGLMSSSPIPFLNRRHYFQRNKILHLGLRTGFCGSLTTFASWNTQMVMMMIGSADKQSQFFSSIAGYVIGLEAALASLAVGQRIGIWLHRKSNPELAHAEDLHAFPHAAMKEVGKYGEHTSGRRINRDLPDFERRFLDGLLSEEEGKWAQEQSAELDALLRWKKSTQALRPLDRSRNERNGQPPDQWRHLRAAMEELELVMLVHGDEPSPTLLNVASDAGWHVDALRNYATNAISDDEFHALGSGADVETASKRCFFWTTSISALIAVGLLVAFRMQIKRGNHELFYEISFLSAILAPFGTLLRWQFTRMNGVLTTARWFPLGTFVSNVLACAISISADVLVTSRGEDDMWTHAVLGAIETGFAGSLSTVSSFVVEADSLQRMFPQHAKSSQYILSSLVSSCLVGVIIYAPVEFIVS